MLNKDQLHHHAIDSQIGSDIKRGEQEMAQLQGELEDQLAIKELKQMYEQWARKINHYEPQAVIR